MRFRQAVTVCFQDYFTFSGRARRSEYWWFILFILVGNVVLSIFDRALFGDDMLLGLNGLFTMFVLIPQLAASWRRLHDTGRPGWFNFLPSIPLAALISIVIRSGGEVNSGVVMLLGLIAIALALMVLFFHTLPTHEGPNRFGPEPPG
jgi:uncharacterized membrane protein YhaH (DUF805 family)